MMRQMAAGNIIWGLKKSWVSPVRGLFCACFALVTVASRLPRGCLAVVALLVAVALAAHGLLPLRKCSFLLRYRLNCAV